MCTPPVESARTNSGPFSLKIASKREFFLGLGGGGGSHARSPSPAPRTSSSHKPPSTTPLSKDSAAGKLSQAVLEAGGGSGASVFHILQEKVIAQGDDQDSFESGTTVSPSLSIPMPSSNRRAGISRTVTPGIETSHAKLVKGSEVSVVSNLFHPFLTPDCRVAKIVVKKIYSSKTRPLLLSLHASSTPAPAGDQAVCRSCKKPKSETDNFCPKCGTAYTTPTVPGADLIFKCKDDVRKDMFVLQLFHCFNYLWKRHEVHYRGLPVAAHVYGCVAMDPKAGCIEFVPQSTSVDHLLTLNLQGVAVDRLIASAAGAYMAAYVLGVRDRHYENILVRQDGLLFHIDFGNVLGNTVTIDTSSVAFTPDLPRVMGDQWLEFIDICVEAFATLRKYHMLIAPLAGRLFSCIAIATPESVMDFFQQYLFLDLDEKSSRERMRSKLLKAPKNFKTRLKNIVHEVKVAMDKPLNNNDSNSPPLTPLLPHSSTISSPIISGPIDLPHSTSFSTPSRQQGGSSRRGSPTPTEDNSPEPSICENGENHSNNIDTSNSGKKKKGKLANALTLSVGKLKNALSRTPSGGTK